MIRTLFPYKLYLHIFQLEEYNVSKFLNWLCTHFFTRNLENKKPIVWTQKAILLYNLSRVLSLISLIFLTYLLHVVGFLIGLFLTTQSYIFLVAAFYLLRPIENYQKNKINKQTEQKLASFTHLKIIGITGSYGKTSVKEFLYQILRSEYAVLKTPESYNTPQGIAKVVNLELDKHYEYFICEMGAYKIGDIKQICDIVHPQYGILTGINEQHLESFGSLENTTKGKFELIASLPAHGFGIVNIDNQRIRDNFMNYDKKIFTYGFTDEKFSIQKIKQTIKGSEFLLIMDGKVYNAKTRLLGNSNLQNILAAGTMSYLLGMKTEKIVAAIEKLQPVSHRLEIREYANMTIIDDAYNSNVDGFKEAAKLLLSFNKPTVFVTPGIVDLGVKTLGIHRELAQYIKNVDYVILIGKSDRTRGIKEGMVDKSKIIDLTSIKEVWGKIETLKLKDPVILLENDLPDNY